jgi:hypothetical protein
MPRAYAKVLLQKRTFCAARYRSQASRYHALADSFPQSRSRKASLPSEGIDRHTAIGSSDKVTAPTRSEPESGRMAACVHDSALEAAAVPTLQGFVAAVDSRQTLHIRSHDITHPTDTRIMGELRHGAGSVSPCFSQGFQSYVEADLVSVLETVGHRLSRVIDMHRHSFNHMSLLTFMKCSTGKAYDSKWEIIGFRISRLSIQGHPDFMRGLGSKIVKSQRRHQTHCGFGHTFTNFCQSMIFFHGRI